MTKQFQFSLRALFLLVTMVAVALCVSKLMGAMFAIAMFLVVGVRMARQRQGERDARIVGERPMSEPGAIADNYE